MPYSRQRRRVAATGRIAVRLNTAQRDLLIHSSDTPQGLGHALHRAPVRGGKLSVRVTREELGALIAAAAKIGITDRRAERSVDTWLRYLESLEDRFDDPEDSEDPDSPA